MNGKQYYFIFIFIFSTLKEHLYVYYKFLHIEILLKNSIESIQIRILNNL